MEIDFLNCFVGAEVYIKINYSNHISNSFLVKERGWLLKNTKQDTYALAFYNQNGDLDYLPVFEHNEVEHVEILSDKQLDMNQVAPEWRTTYQNNSKTQDNIHAGMTPKGPYQTSGMNWL